MKKAAIFPALVIVLVISVTAKTKTFPEAQQHFEKANQLLKRMDYEGAIAESKDKREGVSCRNIPFFNS